MRKVSLAAMTAEERALFEEPNVAHLATTRPESAPHVAPVWVDVEDGAIVVNTAEGRVKERNIRRDPRVAISITKRDDPYVMVSVTGTAELTREGADEHIDKLAKKYIGKDRYPWRRPGEKRVLVRIRPERVASMGL